LFTHEWQGRRQNADAGTASTAKRANIFIPLTMMDFMQRFARVMTVMADQRLPRRVEVEE
jgi:hypothetical protein